MKNNLKDLQKDHQRTAFQTYLKEIIYGGNDGIVTTFAVVAGFTGAQQATSLPQFSVFTVLLFGFANLFADATSMGLGNFISLRSEKDFYKSTKKKELHEIRFRTEKEKEETKILLQAKGFTSDQANTLTNIYSTNETYWVEFMMNQEHELPNPEKENPYLTSLSTFLAFIFFGFIPISPYIIFGENSNSFAYSIFFTFLALTLLGVIRWRVTGDKVTRSVLEILVVGGTSSIIAYIVGTVFKY